MEFEIKSTPSFTRTLSQIKHLVLNLTKYAWGKLQNSEERYKDELSKWRDSACSWIGSVNIVKMSVLPKVNNRFNAILVKIPASCFVEIDRRILKFVQKNKRSRVAKLILKEKNTVGGLTLPRLKAYYKATVIKTVWYWWKNRQINQWNRLESPEIDPHKYSQLIFDKGVKAIQWHGDSISINGAGIKLYIHISKKKCI